MPHPCCVLWTKTMDASLQRLVRYVQQVSREGVSAQAQHAAKQRLIDSLGCAVAAFSEPFCQQLRQLAAAYSHREHRARIWGTDQTTSLEMAALVNGTMLRYLDLSDTVLSRSNGHPSDMIGGLIAVAEARHANGMALLQAIVLSYEIYISLCDASAMAAKGLDQATAAAVGTAGGVALLLGLDEVQTAHALSLALTAHLHLFNVRCGELSDWKGCAGPNAARHGVFSALLAQAGISGPSAPIEGKGGLTTVLGSMDWQLGEGPARILNTHLKLHPVCYHGQSAVDAALVMRRKVPADQVQRVHIVTYEAAFLSMGSAQQSWVPANRETADHSLPYVVATVWEEGELLPLAYEREQLQRLDRLAWMQRITVESCPQMTREFPSRSQVRMEVTDLQGCTSVHTQFNPRGHANDPISDVELERKFCSNFSSWGDADKAQHLLMQVWQLDKLPQLQPVLDVLGK